ncbi:MAG TPA: MBL fold metallo-hydrolase, partial [Stenomitos sp.]
DVRNEEEFAASRIEGRHAVTTVNIPYFDFIEDDAAAIARMPFSREDRIVVLCAKGGSSDYVAGVLREQGYQALNHVGGMIEWADFYDAHDVVAPSEDFVLVQFDRPGKASLSYLVGSQGEAIIVDPNRNIAPYLAEAERRGLVIKHVMDSHVHADYISGGPALAEATGATYHLSGACGYQGALRIDATPGPIQMGSLSLEKLATPGHTPGSMSLLVEGRYLLSGDTLFVRSVGRPDLGGQAEPWAKQLYQTLYVDLAELSDEIEVLPSHYSSFEEMREDGVVIGQLGELRRTNDGMQARSEAEFIAFIRENMRPQPETYATIRKLNLAVLQLDEAKITELDLGKNQCAASQGAPCPSTLSAVK